MKLSNFLDPDWVSERRPMVHLRNRVGMAQEPILLNRLLKHLKADVVLDVGANAGQYARMLRRRARYAGPIVSFEPIPEMVTLLSEASASDPLWTVEELAVSDIDGIVDFHVMHSSQMSSLAEPDMEHTPRLKGLKVEKETIAVRTERLITVLDRLRRDHGYERPFLKMDTQGLDLSILKGAEGQLGGVVGVQTEMTIQPIYKTCSHLVDVLPFLQGQGFTLSAIFPSNASHFPELIDTDGVFLRSDLV